MVRVITAGGFDPIHVGHISHIRAAKQLGDWLTVIVNSDNDMIKKKGYSFMPQQERMEIIRALRDVDEVVLVIDNDGTVTTTLAILQPDIFAKGGDRTPDNLPESEVEVCQEYGIKIVYGVGNDKVQSSSELVANAKEVRNNGNLPNT